MTYVDVLKALADEKRLQIMCLLMQGTKCVCEIEQAGLIQSTKRGQWVHYYIPENVFIRYPFVAQLIQEVSEQSAHHKERME